MNLGPPYRSSPARTTPSEFRAGNDRVSYVLVVDDEKAVRSLVSDILTRHGYIVIEAVDGEDALGICAHPEVQIDVVVTDVNMPRLGGTELAAALHDSRPNTAVILMSGYEPGAIGYTGREPFLHKPFTLSTLLNAVGAAASSQ
jgi:two-component system, cell cycle sensor histidine kinase and response regulator CckA